MATATRDERLSALRSVLEGCGYSDREVAEGFPIWLPGRDVIRPDYVAFTHPDQRDMSTSAIVAQVADGLDDIRERWVPAAAAIAAPVVLIALPERIAAWSSAPDQLITGELTSAPVATPAVIVNRLRMVTPEAINRVKNRGFQNALFPFDINMLNASRQRARSYLTDQVETALVALGGIDDPRADRLVPKLVVGALATLMIHDKSQYNARAYHSAGSLIDIAQQRFPGYFDWLSDLTSSQFQLFSSLVDNLRSNINFAGLEPAMVADVYEQALFTKLQRREQGTYYTPPQLAEQILNVIPLEHLEPDRRQILDPACGSGTMLLAAAKRLTQIEAEKVGSYEWHRYLTSHLRGFDSDPFATEVTKLCLLMTALPIGNHWQVSSTDTLNSSLPEDNRPYLMISNPPWKFQRDPVRSIERATLFLSWMLDNLADEGFLACVLPLSWLNRNNTRASRSALLQGARLVEAWRLPSSVFHNTRPTTAPAVIIAQKLSGGHQRGRVTLVKTVRDPSLPAFFSDGIADEAYLVDPGMEGERLTLGPVTRAISGLTDFTTLGRITTIHNGRPARPGRSVRSPEEANHSELGSLRALQAFSPIDPNLLSPVKYPDDYDRANPSDERVRAHKVIVTAKNFGTRNPWRINVGYDQYGVSLREMFHMIIPNEHWQPWAGFTEVERFSAIMAVLGSGMASCFIDENEPTRNISTRRIASIPFPSDTNNIRRLAEVGNLVSEAVAADNSDRVAFATSALEVAVNEIYRLQTDVRTVIAKRLAGAVGFDGAIRYSPEPHKEILRDRRSLDLPSFGQVLGAGEDGLVLWISGLTGIEGSHVPALPQIPGWLCEGGTDFRVEGDLSDLQSVRFSFHTYDWLTEDELTRPESTL